MLWGNFAKGKAKLIDNQHKIIISGHPSPLNTANPFIGCNCFIDCNKYLEENNISPVNWNL
jgi:uracil-DNA glycosylase